jgi:hypothetical protein
MSASPFPAHDFCGLSALLCFAGLKLLGHFFEVVTLNDVANFVFGKISKLHPALNPGSHFFHVILETAQRGNSSVVDWLAAAQDAGSTRT